MSVKLMAINIPTRNSSAARAFYSNLCGVETGLALSKEVTAAHLPLPDGTWLWLSPPQHKEDRNVTAYFAVDDLEAALKKIARDGAKAEGGAKVLVQPTDMMIDREGVAFYAESLERLGVPEAESLKQSAAKNADAKFGRFALVQDPDGNVIGLIEVEPHSHRFYNLGKFAQPVPQQILEEHKHAIPFAKQKYDDE